MTRLGVPYCDSPPERFKHAIDINTPISGAVMPLTTVNNALFSLGVIGLGARINVTGSQLYSPMLGTITALSPTGNRIDFKSNNGLLLRFAFYPDITAQHGERFRFYVREGAKVNAGDCILDFDRQHLKAAVGDLNITVTIMNKTSPRAINLHIPPSAQQKRVVASQDRLLTAYW